MFSFSDSTGENKNSPSFSSSDIVLTKRTQTSVLRFVSAYSIILSSSIMASKAPLLGEKKGPNQTTPRESRQARRTMEPLLELEVPERAVYMVFLTVFMDILAATISTPVMPFYAARFGADTLQIGYLFAAWSFCSTVFAPLLGAAADRFGRRPILLAALIGAGCANVCQGLSVYTIDGLSFDLEDGTIGRTVGADDSTTGSGATDGSHVRGVIRLLPALGPALGFYVFGFCRAFSGVFAAIGTVTNVYMADVIPKPLLGQYMAKMSVVGPLAFTLRLSKRLQKVYPPSAGFVYKIKNTPREQIGT